MQTETGGSSAQSAPADQSRAGATRRYRLAEWSDEDRRHIINVMKPLVGPRVKLDPEEYAQKFKQLTGIDLDPRDAMLFARLAAEENLREARRRADQIRDDWLYDNNLLWHWAVDYAGTPNFKVRLNGRWKDKGISGTFLLHKKNKAGNVPVIELEMLAMHIARETGRDDLDVEQEFFDFFNELTKPQLYRQYYDWKQSQADSDRQAEMQAQEEFMKLEEARLQEEVGDLMTRGAQLDMDWIEQHNDVWKALYKQLFDTDKAPNKPSRAQLDAVNAALAQDRADATAFAQAWQALRKKAWAETREQRERLRDEYREKLRALRDAIFDDKTDLAAKQREARDFCYKYVPRGFRETFLDSIGKLVQYSMKPTRHYPDGRRQAEFEALLKDMDKFSKDLRRDQNLAEIGRILEDSRTRRTDKNVPYSAMGERQAALDRIAQVFRMSPETAALEIDNEAAMKSALAEELEALPAEGEEMDDVARQQKEALLDRIDKDLFYLEHFGALAVRDADTAEKSLHMLEKFVREGKMEFAGRKLADLQKFQDLRDRIRRELTQDPQPDVPGDRELDRSISPVDNFFYMSESITRMLDEFSRTSSLAALDESAAGHFIRRIDAATQTEQSNLNSMQKWLDGTLRDVCGVSGLVKKGKFLNGAMREEDTGLHITEYGTRVGEKENAHTVWGHRGRFRSYVHVNHVRRILDDVDRKRGVTGIVSPGGLDNFKFLRQTLKDAGFQTGKTITVATLAGGANYRVYTDLKSGLVEAYDVPAAKLDILKGNKVFPLSDISIAGARQQIADRDAGMEKVKSGEFGNDIDDAQWNTFLENERGKAEKIELISPDPSAPTRQAPLKLSPGAAMQLVLTWEQPHYRANMEWNGYSEKLIGDIKAWLDAKDLGYLKLAYAMRDFIARHERELDRAVFERYGAHLPHQENFFYGDFSGSVSQRIQDAGFGNPAGGMTVSANFLTGRRFHLNPPSLHTNAIALFMRKNIEQNHFLAWTQVVRELRAVYGKKDVQNTIIKEFGQAAWNNFREKIETIAANGSAAYDRAVGRIYNAFFRTWAPSNIALNPSSIMKQIGGSANYLNYVPFADFLKYLAEANGLNPAYNRWLAEVRRSKYLRNRQAGGLDPSLVGTLNYTRRGGAASPVSDKLVGWATKGTLWADAQSATWGGYAAYRYFEELARKKGLPETAGVGQESVHDFAMRMWMRATDETQQSGYTKDLNHFTSAPGLWRFLTTYRLNPMQTAALEISAIRKYLKDKTPENRAIMLRRMIVNHLVATTTMNFIGSIFRHGVNVGDYLDDWPDYVTGWMLGSFDALWLFGQGTVAILMGIFGERRRGQMDAVPLIGELFDDIFAFKKAADGEPDPIKCMKGVGDLLMSAGPPQTRAVGLGISAVSKLVRKVKKMLPKDEI